MTQFEIAVAWLVLSPIALITNIIAIIVVCHYKSQFHGTDVTFISLFVSMAMHALVVLPLPAALSIHDEGWMFSELCSFYVWLILCVRMSELGVTVIMNFHWMCILRFTSGQEVYSSATVVKILVIVAWVAAALTGIVPVTGPSFYTYYDETFSRKLIQNGGGGGVNSSVQYSAIVRGECKFLPQGLGTSFILFFILVTLPALIISLVASADTLAVFHYMRRTAVNKYKAGRFYLPSSSYVNPALDNPSGNHTSASPSPRVGLGEEAGFARTGSQHETEHVIRDHDNNGSVSVIRSNGRLPGDYSQTDPRTSSDAAGAFQTEDFDSIHSVETRSYGQTSDTAAYSHSVPSSGSLRGGASSAATVVLRPSEKSGVAKSNPSLVHARYNELNLSSELCRVVLCFTILAALLNHLPFVVLQFVQLVEVVDRQTAETTVLWLTLIQSLLLPHVLWALSRRYRHALSYTWTVHVLRDDSAKEEDTSACTLQSYTRRVRTPEGGTVRVMAKSRVQGPITMTTTTERNIVREGQANGNAVPVRDNSLNSNALSASPEGSIVSPMAESASADVSSARREATEVITTDLDDGMTVITNLASQKVTYIYDTPPGTSSRKNARSESSGNSSPPTSPSRSSLGTPSRGSVDIKRTASARKAWKEQMRKKHLPAIFINEAFEADETTTEALRAESEVQMLPDVARVHENDVTKSASPGGGDGGETKKGNAQFHFYMSGDYHHDYLRSDSLPRLESESEGGSFQYADSDIEGILDRQLSIPSKPPSQTNSIFLGDSREAHPHDISVTGKLQTSTSFGSEGEEYSASFHPPRSSSLKTKPQNTSTDAALRQVNPGNRKPPRRSAAVMRQQSRPSLQHQKSLQDDPEYENTAGTAQHPTEEQVQKIFYPTFAAVSESTKAVPTTDLDEDSQDNTNGSMEKLDHDVLAPESDFSPVDVKYDIGVANAGEVYVSIADVTKDSTHTEGPDEPKISNEAAKYNNTNTHSIGDFEPQEQATVLGILLADGTELPIGSSQLNSEVPETTDFDHVDAFSDNFKQSSPFIENHSKTQTQANPFYPGIREDLPQNDKSLDSATENKPVTQKHQSDNSFDDHGMNRTVDTATEGNCTENNTTTENKEPQSPSDDTGDHLMITRVGSDVAVPENAVVLDVVETSSMDSEPSVVIEPYTVDRRPPWMDTELEDDGLPIVRRKSRNPFRPSFDAEDSDALGSSGDFGSSFGSNAELRTIFGNQTPTRSDSGNPFFSSSFTGKSVDSPDSHFFKSSGNSEHFGGEESGGESPQPYPMFDEETDKGFEDALALEHVIGSNPYYGNFGRCFESIEEEPEDLSDSMNSPVKGDEKDFATTRISRPSSQNTDLSEFSDTNPFKNKTASFPSQDSDSSVKSVSVNPFEAISFPSTDSGTRDESLPEYAPISNKETIARSFDEPKFNGDLPLEDTNVNSAPAPRVRLTKPAPWPSIDGQPSELGFESDFTTAKDNEASKRADSFGQNSDECEEDSGFSQTNHVDDLNDSVSPRGEANAKKPPVPLRPVKNRKMNIPGGNSATSYVEPVYF